MQAPIGVFDSGYGGLTILKELKQQLPQYDYLYLGDNARAPYGTRSFDTVYQYTLEAVEWFFQQGCSLVILACNTASAKALRNIQQLDLPNIAPDKRVLGVIRPSSEVLGQYSSSHHLGILGTSGTVQSESYPIELSKFAPEAKVYQQACPMWVPLIENGQQDGPGADYFVKLYIDQLFGQSPKIDTVLLACTHYPLISKTIAKIMGDKVTIIDPAITACEELIAKLTQNNSLNPHPTEGVYKFYVTDIPVKFQAIGELFLNHPMEHLEVVSVE